MSNGKMTILLIDDDPVFTFCLERKTVALDIGCSSEESNVIEKNFNLIWLKDISEVKAYFDGIKVLKNTNAKKLNSLNIIPEIIVFDYCLTRSTSSQRDRAGDPTNPNVSLYETICEYSPSHYNLSYALNKKPEKNISHSGLDRYGLVAGTFLCSFFYDYITTGLPTTAYSDIAKSTDEAGLIEWLHEDQMRFANAERLDQLWGGLLYESLVDTRDNLLDLVATGSIKIDLYGLMDTINMLGNQSITYNQLSSVFLEFQHSSYGKKEFLLSALFYDHFFDSEGALFGRFDKDEKDTEARNSELIINSLNEIVLCGLKGAISCDEYACSYALCQSYIDAWKEGNSIQEPFLTKRGYSKDRQKRLFILAMVLWLGKADRVDSLVHFNRQIKEIFFAGQTQGTKRRAQKAAGIKVGKIMAGEIYEKEKDIIRLHSENVHSWPEWWKL